MKSSNTLLLSVLLSFGLAGVGFVLATLINVDGMRTELLFAAGIAIGGIAVSLLKPKTQQEKELATKTLYVGNLPYRANEVSVRKLFSEHGRVLSVRLMKDKQTGKRRGFGFVEMAEADAGKAVDALNDKEYQQRTLKVREANERAAPPKNEEQNTSDLE